MSDYPAAFVPVGHVEPVPRRVRGMIDGRMVVDTTRAVYVWEWPPYPQWYIPLEDVEPGLLDDSGRTEQTSRGTASLATVNGRADAARTYAEDAAPGLDGRVRFEWSAMDSWFEEDEEVFVHPRSPYARVDAIRSGRAVRVELDGIVLAESSSTVMVFETGLPTRYYFPRTEVDFAVLVETETVSSCPYKGTTGQYWSVRTPQGMYEDYAWAYDFPTRQLLPITGLVAFYNEKVDLTIDGIPIERPQTHFS
jgi:uncharacterized protein (DUF427 family)